MSNKINVSFTFCSSYLWCWKFKRKIGDIKTREEIKNPQIYNCPKILMLHLLFVVVISGARRLKE